MVKHTIQNHIHACFMSQPHQLFQVLLVSKRGIYLIIIGGIVLMDGIRPEDRRQIEDIHPQIPDMIKMPDKPPQ